MGLPVAKIPENTQKTSTSKAGMSHGINNMSQKGGLDRKLECPLESTKLGLHRMHGGARAKARMLFGISKSRQSTVDHRPVQQIPKAGMSFRINKTGAYLEGTKEVVFWSKYAWEWNKLTGDSSRRGRRIDERRERGQNEAEGTSRKPLRSAIEIHCGRKRTWFQ